ncbi:MAG TPA: preprotein translocase subunit SecY [Candidatus Omnitrophota bacterium]|nr:preprotein translocase subunit SecY [Candidatus Omnitrophota bacterium]
MLQAFANCFRIPDLKKKILFTLGIIVLYRLGCHVPTPGVNGSVLAEFFRRINETSGGGTIFGMMNMFSGGALEQMTVFSLGIMPYISSSIIMQLLTAVIPALEKLSKEGQAGYQKINQYTRYGTLGLCLIQSYFIALWLESPQAFQGLQVVNNPGFGFRFTTMFTLSCGTMLLMWLGEQIQERGIGQGISIIIAAGILSRIPDAVRALIILLSPKTAAMRQIQPFTLVMMIAFLIGVILSITLITQGQRRIPVQYARRIVGRKVYGGQSTYIPLKVDTAGIIAIIFAQSILLFPATMASFIPNQGLQTFANMFLRGHFVYYFLYGLLIIFFCYFYTAIVFNPVDVADNMKKHGGFIPGVRPGAPTAEFLDFVMTRITLAGAFFMCAIAVMPDAIMAAFKVPYLVASFFGGTSILIVVGVMLDTVKQMESQLLMRHYDGFMKAGHIRGRR